MKEESMFFFLYTLIGTIRQEFSKSRDRPSVNYGLNSECAFSIIGMSEANMSFLSYNESQ